MTEHPTNYAKLLRQIEDAAELLTRLAQAIPTRWQHIVDAQPGQPRAQALDADGTGSASVVVCDLHRCDISACHQRGDIGCKGTPIPKRSDPTGQAATSSDPAARDLRDLRRLGSAILRDTDRMVTILAGYGPRSARADERMASTNGDPGCQSCGRVPSPHVPDQPAYAPVHGRTRVGEERFDLCQWCKRWVAEHGTLPPRDAVTAHHRGEKLRKTA